jgi:tryptophan synthase alpha chain
VVAYVPLGDPVTGGDAVLDAYRASGVAVLEIGIPTRDPWLDGPEVAGSMRRAIDARVDPGEIARRLARWRAGLPVPSPAIVWFTYPDLPLAEIEHAAGLGAIDGLLLLEEGRHPLSTRVPGFLASLGLAHCAFLPWEPAGDDLRAAERATGYVMVQARPGPTGADRDPEVPVRQVELAREHARGRPVVAGFGIHDAATVRRVIEAGVDGVVVGSACIRALREGGAEGLRDLLLPLVAAASVPRRLGAGAGAGGR